MEKEKAREKNSAMKRFLRKKTKNIIDERRLRMEALRKKEKEDRERKISGKVEKKLQPLPAQFEKKGN
jgi:U3 small nucleolar RNA-associated protein 7